MGRRRAVLTRHVALLSDSHYFVRFTSLAFKDEENPQYPYEAFSAMFYIQSMTGTFNATVLAAIDATNSSSSSVIASASSTVSLVPCRFVMLRD